MQFDDLLLDDYDRLTTVDHRDLLAVTASAGASLRAARAMITDSALDRATEDGRPRAILVAGGGGSRAAGEILSAVAGSGSQVPVMTAGGPGLPGWVGPNDIVVALSASGNTSETLDLAREAARRGCRLIAVCPRGSGLDELVESTRGAASFQVAIPPISGAWRARTLMWSLATPLLVVAGELGLVENVSGSIEAAAVALDEIAQECSPARETVENPAKQWAVDAAVSLPMIWGSGDVGGVAARRYARQLAENAGIPAVAGTLPEAARTQAGLMSGPRAGQAHVDDIFRDRVDDPEASVRLRLVLLRDTPEHPEVEALANAGATVAQSRNVPVTEHRALAGPPLVRLASLIGVSDFASVYAGLALGIDPMDAAHELDGGRR